MITALVVLAAAALAVEAGEAPPLRVLARLVLPTTQSGLPMAWAPTGDGLTVKVKPNTEECSYCESLTVVAGDRAIFETEGGSFQSAALYEYAGASHLVVAEYTGGAHCCGTYHVFSRLTGTGSWRYLGSSGEQNGGPFNAWDAIVLKDGELYLRELDNRFDYFHACHACSLLVNMTSIYSKLTPSGLVKDSLAFRKDYLEQAATMKREIKAETAKRTEKPSAILSGADFTDDLGQLLVKRTILYLQAGEDHRAWETFEADVRRNYQSVEGVDLLRKEILESLGR